MSDFSSAQEAQTSPERIAAPGDTTTLDRITIVSRTGETPIETMASVSQVSGEQLARRMAATPGEILFGVPGVNIYSQGRPSVANVNIRGLQDAGRVSVIVDGARQNFHKTGHEVSRMFWLDPELVKQVDVMRGPSANTFGSGAIGGVVYFETKDAEDFLRDDETYALSTTGRYDSNGSGWTVSTTGAFRFNESASVLGNIVWRDFGDYKDGGGTRVDHSGFDVLSGHLKGTVRPTEFSKLTLGWTGASNEWSSSAIQDNSLKSNTFTGAFEISDAEEKWLNLSIKGAVNSMGLEEVRSGTTTDYDLRTSSLDVWNTSHFDTGPVQHQLTFGGDWVYDDFTSQTASGGANFFNPNGKRTVWGGYVQDKLRYDWLEVVAGLRYDAYDLEGSSESSGSRLSPRVSVGISPFSEGTLAGLQVYGSYAEGYRAPTTSEAFISGMHAGGAPFPFLPNPDLKPETGKTWEAGVNYAAEGLMSADDTLRIKAAYFHNDVKDYITFARVNVVPGTSCSFSPMGFCMQNQNIQSAEIHGFELESYYDAGRYFGGISVSIVDGEEIDLNGVRSDLTRIPATSVTLDGGMRFLERRLTVGGEVQFNKAPKGSSFADDYTLVNLYANYQATDNLRFDFRVDNLLDEKYMLPMADVSAGSYNQPGLTVKVGATMRLGG
ncbi:TonB-dependent receptor domain-containing protein [Nitratireductor pacificus]|uniref:TonB-dependent heme/hemoglobin receptor family protein n=1 Tax=Nitratireductor pacificus pht-3B TaxID=391937 RepID=K2MC00_9HYPH|nr:TonB-dependent receptor [Nitratireductor pacificus]EKF19631.1 TonB-dependent heme/hemoglobin receptor family protein [Nitratireductor pacificus pht-3B]